MGRTLGILRFRIGAPLASAVLERCLGRGFRLGEAEQRRLERIYLDSVDARLANAGRLFSSERGERGARLVLSKPGRGSEESLELELAPRFASQIPEGRLAEKLRRILGVRALLPRFRVEVDAELWPVLDENGRLVARLLQERSRAHAVSRDPLSPLPAALVLREVPGQPRVFGLLARRFEQAGFEPEERNAIAEAQSAQPGTPGRAEPSARSELDPEAPAAAAAGPILRPLFAAISEHQEGALLDLDSECLHDFRVALRRARSAAKLLRPCLPADAEPLRDELRWLARLTSPVRDADVRLLRLDAFRQQLPAASRPGLDAIAKHVLAQRQPLRDRLADALAGPRYRALMRGWDKLLEQVPAAGTALTTRALALQSLERLQRRALKSARADSERGDAAELHELRLRCKELRYAVETFRSLFSGRRVGKALRSLSALQEELGDFHDCAVQIAELERLPSELGGREASQDALRAAAAMLEHLHGRRARALARSAKQIERFCSARAAKRIPASLAGSPERRGASPADAEP